MAFDLERFLFAINNDPRVGNKEQDIIFNKFFNEISRKANEMGLLSKCKICGKDITGRANSHSVPRSILENISVSGQYCQITCAIANNIKFGPINRINKTGLNKTGIFHLVCNECENKMFRDYENPEFLNKLSLGEKELLSDKILAEIMLKSALRERYKKEYSRNLYILMNDIAKQKGINVNYSTYSDELNISEYDDCIDACLDILNNNKTNQFEIFYFDILDHPSLFAAQALLAIQKTVNGTIINDVYNYDKNYKIVSSVFVVFPLKSRTICTAFCLKNDCARMKPYIDYLNMLKKTAQRKLFQSTLMMYTEEIYTNDDGIQKLLNDEYTMYFIKSCIENGTTTTSLLAENRLIYKPELSAPNNFRKAKDLL